MAFFLFCTLLLDLIVIEVIFHVFIVHEIFKDPPYLSKIV